MVVVVVSLLRIIATLLSLRPFGNIFLVIITCCFRTIQEKSERNSKLEYENEGLIIKLK